METEFRGEYYPAFFSIYLNGDYNEKFEELSDLDLGTLAHEYLHYVQNIDTLMGLSNSQHFFVLYNEALKQASQSLIPIKLPEIVNNNMIRFKRFKGQSYPSFNLNYDDTKLGLEDGIVKLYFFKNKIKTKEINFGNICVKEGMAHYFQLMFDDKVKHPLSPYLVISLVCKKIYPKILKEPVKVILLAYLSLSATNDSGLCFYRLLNEINNRSHYYDEMTAIELYTKLKETIRPSISGVKFNSVEEVKIFGINKFNEIMSASMMSGMEYFNNIFSNIRLLNSGKMEGFAEIITDSETNKYEKLYRLFNIYGAPNIRTVNGKNIFPNNSTELIELVGKKLLLDRILNGDDQCKYFPFCSSQTEDPTGDQCFCLEWEDENKCPFTLAFDFFQIKKVGNNGSNPMAGEQENETLKRKLSFWAKLRNWWAYASAVFSRGVRFVKKLI
jgi:hypothetical protein